MFIQPVEKGCRRQHGQAGSQFKQVRIAAHEDCFILLREGDQVVITAVPRNGWRVFRVVADDAPALDQLNKSSSILLRNPLAKLGIGEGTIKFAEQLRRSHQLETAIEPGSKNTRRRAGRGEGGRDDDVRV